LGSPSGEASVTPHFFTACNGDQNAFASGEISVHSLADIFRVSLDKKEGEVQNEESAVSTLLSSNKKCSSSYWFSLMMDKKTTFFFLQMQVWRSGSNVK